MNYRDEVVEEAPLMILRKQLSMLKLLISDKQLTINFSLDMSVLEKLSYDWNVYQSIIHNQLVSAIMNSSDRSIIYVLIKTEPYERS